MVCFEKPVAKEHGAIYEVALSCKVTSGALSLLRAALARGERGGERKPAGRRRSGGSEEWLFCL